MITTAASCCYSSPVDPHAPAAEQPAAQQRARRGEEERARSRAVNFEIAGCSQIKLYWISSSVKWQVKDVFHVSLQFAGFQTCLAIVSQSLLRCFR